MNEKEERRALWQTQDDGGTSLIAESHRAERDG